MAKLKTDTSLAHRQLERNICLSRLFQTDYTVGEYRYLIAKFYGFFSAIEPFIFANLEPANHALLAHRRKTDLLVKDLSLLDIDNFNPRTMTLCDQIPVLNSFARQMGALYVLEGSTLGGRIISKKLIDHFGNAIIPTLNYYQSYGDKVIDEWSAFHRFMADRFDGKEIETNEVVSAAIETFSCLDQWLQTS